MRDAPSIAVLGFRPHTYWAAAVALAGPAQAPRVVARRRITLAAGGERFVYHQAAALGLAQAPALIGAVRAAVQANAVREVGDLVADLRRHGVTVRLVVAPAATARLPDSLDDILRVHARLHAAEGDFYRDAVASACGDLGLTVRRVAERDLPARLCQRLGVDAATLQAWLATIGAPLGPPWSEDYRLASLAAWSGLDLAAAAHT